MGHLYSALQLKIAKALQTPLTIKELGEELNVPHRSTLYSALKGMPVTCKNGYWQMETKQVDILMECIEKIVDELYDGDIMTARSELRDFI
jgi:phage terminase Nu1 subunit (DNA packaging protein)